MPKDVCPLNANFVAILHSELSKFATDCVCRHMDLTGLVPNIFTAMH